MSKDYMTKEHRRNFSRYSMYNTDKKAPLAHSSGSSVDAAMYREMKYNADAMGELKKFNDKEALRYIDARKKDIAKQYERYAVDTTAAAKVYDRVAAAPYHGIPLKYNQEPRLRTDSATKKSVAYPVPAPKASFWGGYEHKSTSSTPYGFTTSTHGSVNAALAFSSRGTNHYNNYNNNSGR